MSHYISSLDELEKSRAETSVRQISDPQLKDITHILSKLNNFVEELAVRNIKNLILEFQNLFLDRWLRTASHTEFYNILRLATQKSTQAKRRLGSLSEREETSYYLGMMAGIEHVFQELYTAEERDLRIIVMAGSQSEKTDRILMCLYTKNGGQGMRHGELAKEVNISDSSLTNTMKRILQSRAVTAVRTGKNTFYTLTPAGQRYCSKKQEPSTRTPSKELLMTLVESAFERPKAIETILKMHGDDVSLDAKRSSYVIKKVKLDSNMFVKKLYENTIPIDDKIRDIFITTDFSMDLENALREDGQDLLQDQLARIGDTV